MVEIRWGGGFCKGVVVLQWDAGRAGVWIVTCVAGDRRCAVLHKDAGRGEAPRVRDTAEE